MTVTCFMRPPTLYTLHSALPQLMGKNKVLVKVNPEGKYVVDLGERRPGCCFSLLQGCCRLLAWLVGACACSALLLLQLAIGGVPPLHCLVLTAYVHLAAVL